ncbi:MAG TPA: hypothetical protein VG838_13410 [Opitutaceae bacterium]|nr:hypothetical protein [Lacunisphaera sp.]HWA10438.1 hypothetical protein [Opitutaceae bacterium]
MNDKPVQRKARFYFDTAASPSHVTFDDGKEERQNFPWSLYVKASWSHTELDLIRVEIGDYLVLLRGHNLGPLFLAIEDRALNRVRARPDLEDDRANEPDSFVTGVLFQKAEPASPLGGKGKQSEIALFG